ncbi:MAG: NADH-quinone oxidoreductase subunit N [bacterium]|nr:NADH-quinone oxidoreductase subunit N [bacterium]
MNAETLKEFFNGEALFATSPLIVLTLGVLCLLLAEILPGAQKARPVLFVAALIGAFVCQVRILRATEPKLVLGETYVADHGSAGWGLLFIFATFLGWVYGRQYYGRSKSFLGEHDVLLLTTTIGMTMMAGAQDLIVFFIGLELLSIPLYCLAAFRRTRNDSVEAGLKYFVLGAFGVAMFLYGAALLYVGTGSLSLIELRTIGATGPLAVAGVGLIVASLFFKLSIFPFHLWVPDVYQGAPTPVTTLMATGTKAAAFAFLLNMTFLLPADSATIIGIIALMTMAAGNLGALVQTDLKRMLAWSGIAHAGTLLIVVAGALAGGLGADAQQAALYYMAAYVFTAGGAFGLISWLEADGEKFTKLENLAGLGERRPGVAAALSLFMLSLGGIPATGGFLGKWFVFSVAVKAELYSIAVIGILLSVVALGYYLRVIVTMYMMPAPDGLLPPMSQRGTAIFATAFCVVMVLCLGVLPGAFVGRVF